jgi:biopolymer transport protein ExbB/TolQ
MNESTISLKSMFLNADPIVQGVMLFLFLASLVTWAIILEKAVVLSRFGRAVRLLKKMARDNSLTREDLDDPANLPHSLPRSVVRIIAVGIEQTRDRTGRESRFEFRARAEGAMRLTLAERLEVIGRRSLFLASVGSTSPFIGLFGTVWGIMHSFIGIASSGETTLAVVAPGIAEALFATAMGLAAAIPAVLGYNMTVGSIKKHSREALGAISLLGNFLALVHFQDRDQDN